MPPRVPVGQWLGFFEQGRLRVGGGSLLTQSRAAYSWPGPRFLPLPKRNTEPPPTERPHTRSRCWHAVEAGLPMYRLDRPRPIVRGCSFTFRSRAGARALAMAARSRTGAMPSVGVFDLACSPLSNHAAEWANRVRRARREREREIQTSETRGREDSVRGSRACCWTDLGRVPRNCVFVRAHPKRAPPFWPTCTLSGQFSP